MKKLFKNPLVHNGIISIFCIVSTISVVFLSVYQQIDATSNNLDNENNSLEEIVPTTSSINEMVDLQEKITTEISNLKDPDVNEETRICPNHLEHNAECGFIEAQEAHICMHIHDENCGGLAEITTCASESLDECETPITICNHQHDETCSFKEAIEGSECNHISEYELDSMPALGAGNSPVVRVVIRVNDEEEIRTRDLSMALAIYLGTNEPSQLSRVNKVEVTSGRFGLLDWIYIKTNLPYFKNFTEFIINQGVIIDDVADLYSGGQLIPTSMQFVKIMGLTRLPTATFNTSAKLTNVELPNLLEVFDRGFSNCTALKTVDFEMVTKICYQAFTVCTSISDVNLPNLTEMGENAFASTDSLNYISLPKVKRISKMAFFNFKYARW